MDPYYLSWRARVFDFQTKFIELAADTNLGMADYVKRRVVEVLNEEGKSLRNARVLCLGAAFKPNVSDMRNSRAVHIIELLKLGGAEVRYHDARVPSFHLGDGHEGRHHDRGELMKSVELTETEIEAADIVVVLVAHPEMDLDLVVRSGRPVFDAINAIGRRDAAQVRHL